MRVTCISLYNTIVDRFSLLSISIPLSLAILDSLGQKMHYFIENNSAQYTFGKNVQVFIDTYVYIYLYIYIYS